MMAQVFRTATAKLSWFSYGLNHSYLPQDTPATTIAPTATNRINLSIQFDLNCLLLSFSKSTGVALINSLITPSYRWHWLIVMKNQYQPYYHLTMHHSNHSWDRGGRGDTFVDSHLSVSVCLSISEHTIPQPCPTVTAVGNDSRTLTRSSFTRSWQCNSSLRTLKCLLI